MQGPVPKRHPRHPLLDLGQLASNPAFESEAGTLSARNMDTPRRPTPAPTAHPNRHTPTKIAYRPSAHLSSTDKLGHSRQKTESPQATPQDPARTRGVSPSRLPAVGSLKFSPLAAPPTGVDVSKQASPEPAAGSALASEVSAPVNSEASADALTLLRGTVEVLSKSMPNTVQQDELNVHERLINTVSPPVHTGSSPAANAVPKGAQASRVLVKDAHAAESLLGSDSKAVTGCTSSARAHHAKSTAALCAHGKRLASEAASDQKVQQSHGLPRESADEAAQKRTPGLFGQHLSSRNVKAEGSTAFAAPDSTPAESATLGASGVIYRPAGLLDSALMPSFGLGAVPLQTSNASQSASIFPSARPHSKSVVTGAQSDMYAVSDALLLDNISAAAASQGSAGSKQSGCASRQTGAASSSSTTPASKGTQVWPLSAHKMEPSSPKSNLMAIRCG